MPCALVAKWMYIYQVQILAIKHSQIALLSLSEEALLTDEDCCLATKREMGWMYGRPERTESEWGKFLAEGEIISIRMVFFSNRITLRKRLWDEGTNAWQIISRETMLHLCTWQMYRDSLKGLYMVARIFFLLLPNCSAWLCLGPA